MSALDDPFRPLLHAQEDDLKRLIDRPTGAGAMFGLFPSAVTVTLHGFDVNEQPLLSDVEVFPGEIIPALSTVPLSPQHVGGRVVVLFDRGDVRRPIVIGVVQEPTTSRKLKAAPPVIVRVDDARHEISADREIVLRCGEASITLTRAGKVIIKGKYIVSRSTGYNKIKGASVDIN